MTVYSAKSAGRPEPPVPGGFMGLMRLNTEMRHRLTLLQPGGHDGVLRKVGWQTGAARAGWIHGVDASEYRNAAQADTFAAGRTWQCTSRSRLADRSRPCRVDSWG